MIRSDRPVVIDTVDRPSCIASQTQSHATRQSVDSTFSSATPLTAWGSCLENCVIMLSVLASPGGLSAVQRAFCYSVIAYSALFFAVNREHSSRGDVSELRSHRQPWRRRTASCEASIVDPNGGLLTSRQHSLASLPLHIPGLGTRCRGRCASLERRAARRLRNGHIPRLSHLRHQLRPSVLPSPSYAVDGLGPPQRASSHQSG